MRVRESLGQLRVAGRDVDFYTDASQRPFPYKSEDELINEGVEANTEPPWGNYDWPMYVPPPNVPSLEKEVYDIRRKDQKRLWAHAGTWNLNRLSTKELNRTKYPPSPDMSGLGQADTGMLSAILGATGLTALVFGAGIGLVSYAIFRSMVKEEKTGWKIALGVGGVGASLFALEGLFVGAASLVGSAVVATK